MKKSLWSARPGVPTAAAGAALGLPGEAVYKAVDHRKQKKKKNKKEKEKGKIKMILNMQDLNFGYHLLFPYLTRSCINQSRPVDQKKP